MILLERLLIHSHTLCYPPCTCSSSDSSSGSYMYHDEVMDEVASSKPKVPLDQEWAAMAKKMLKGADPEKTLTWRTAEVSRCDLLKQVSLLYNKCNIDVTWTHTCACTCAWHMHVVVLLPWQQCRKYRKIYPWMEYKWWNKTNRGAYFWISLWGKG